MKYLYTNKTIGTLLIALFSLFTSCDKVDVNADTALSSSEQTAQANLNLNDGLIYYFPFSGNSIDSVSGEEFDTHGATFEKDRFNHPKSALCFTRNFMYIDAGIYNDPEGTFSFWFNTRSLSDPIAFINQYDSALNLAFYELGVNRDGSIYTVSKKWGWHFESDPFLSVVRDTIHTQPFVKANSWYHIVIRWSEENRKFEIWGNNQKVAATSYAEDWEPSAFDSEFSFPPEIGRERHNPTFVHGEYVYYNGRMDDIRRYNRWISDEEIAALYAQE